MTRTRRADYVYRDVDDRTRARVFRREGGRWDFDLFHRHACGGWRVETFGPEAGDDFRTKREAVRCVAASIGGHAIPIQVATVTEGWPEAPPPYRAPEGAPEIKVGQAWRRGRQVLVVRDVSAGGRRGLRITTQNLVGARPSTGSMIVGRKSAEWTYDEERFRAKFKLDEPELNRAGEPAWLTGCPECGLDPNECSCQEDL